MKTLMLSAAIISISFSHAIAAPMKDNASSLAVFSKFSGLRTIIPSSVRVENLRVHDMTNKEDEEDNITNYSIVMSGKNFAGDVLYDENGNLVSYREKLTDTKLPSAVANAIETKYPEATITKDKEIIRDINGEYKNEYKVNFKEGDKHGYAVVNADGDILRSRK